MKRKSQQQKILEYLQEGNSITQTEATTLFNCIRLSAVIKQLKYDGYEFNETKILKGSGRGEYTLKEVA